MNLKQTGLKPLTFEERPLLVRLLKKKILFYLLTPSL